MTDARREEQLRIQAVGAAISRRDWHAVEQAYNAIRDEFDRRPNGAGSALDREWLKTEISAIDTWYRGDPSYMHDAYWMKDRVLKLLDHPAALSSPATPEPVSAPAGEVVALCDCERSANGLGMSGRVCDCRPTDAIKRLLTTAKLLYANAEGCAVNHYGDDFAIHGLPGWLADCAADIAAADAALNPAPGHGEGVPVADQLMEIRGGLVEQQQDAAAEAIGMAVACLLAHPTGDKEGRS